MKKFLVVIIVLGVIVGGVAWAVMRQPEQTVCTKIADLCGVEGTKADLDECVAEIQEIEKVLGKEPVERVAKCVDGAKTCAEAMGCVAGESMNTMQDQLNEFMKGVRKSLDQKK
jgi:hypothetical protein